MNPPNPYLLILESDLRLSESLRAYLQQSLPEVLPLLARTVAEANVLVYQYQFNAYLIDVSLEDLERLSFVEDLKTILPDASIILMSEEHPIELEMHFRNLGKYTFLEKPVDLLQLQQKIRPLFPQPQESDTFQGSLRQMRLVDLIQVKCLGRDSCQLNISDSEGHTGVISIRWGEILYAQTDHLTGNEAFNEILRWKQGVFHEEEFVAGLETNVHGGWEKLLMEAVHHSDECAALRVV